MNKTTIRNKNPEKELLRKLRKDYKIIQKNKEDYRNNSKTVFDDVDILSVLAIIKMATEWKSPWICGSCGLLSSGKKECYWCAVRRKMKHGNKFNHKTNSDRNIILGSVPERL